MKSEPVPGAASSEEAATALTTGVVAGRRSRRTTAERHAGVTPALGSLVLLLVTVPVLSGCGDESTAQPAAAAATPVAAEVADAAPRAPAPPPPGMEEVDLSSRGQPVKLYLPVGASINRAPNTFEPALDVRAPGGFALQIGPQSFSFAEVKEAEVKEGGEIITLAEQGKLGWLLRHHARGIYTVEIVRKDVRRYCEAHARRDQDLEPMITACRTMRPAHVDKPATIFSDEGP